MVIVAGPPGAGKSSRLAVKSTGVEWFNADDRAAELNAGQYRKIPPHIRQASGSELKEFIDSRIEAQTSFAFETTLRSDAGFAQIRRAKELGFRVLMDYVAAGPVEEHIRRVKNRAAVGGHSASEDLLRDIYQSSMKNLVLAFEENRHGRLDFLRIYDNSEEFGRPQIVVSLIRGVPRSMAQNIPVWLENALASSPFNVARLRGAMRRRGLGR